MSRHTTVPAPLLLGGIVAATIALVYYGRKAAAAPTAAPQLGTGMGNVPAAFAEHVSAGLVTDALDASMLA